MAFTMTVAELIDADTSGLLGKHATWERVPLAEVADPHDEPASVLLERIRAERAAQGAVKNVRSQAIVEISLMAGSLYGVRVWLYFGPPCGAVALWAGSHIGASR